MDGVGALQGNGISITGDGSAVYAAGEFWTGSERDLYLAKLDPSGGTRIWETIVANPGEDNAKQLIYQGGTLYMVGSLMDNTGKFVAALLNFDPVTGRENWRQTLSGAGGGRGEIVAPSGSNGVVWAGTVSNADPDIFVQKVRSDNTVVFTSNLRGTAPAGAQYVGALLDNGVITLLGSSPQPGHSGSQITVFRLDALGNLQSATILPGAGGGDSQVRGAVMDASGTIFGAGLYSTAAGDNAIIFAFGNSSTSGGGGGACQMTGAPASIPSGIVSVLILLLPGGILAARRKWFIR